MYVFDVSINVLIIEIWFEKAKNIDTSTFLTDTDVKSYKIGMFKLNSLLGKRMCGISE